MIYESICQQVKGVAIDDFLRYQQDLIETFESGYSGYRGLTGEYGLNVFGTWWLLLDWKR